MFISGLNGTKYLTPTFSLISLLCFFVCFFSNGSAKVEKKTVRHLAVITVWLKLIFFIFFKPLKKIIPSIILPYCCWPVRGLTNYFTNYLQMMHQGRAASSVWTDRAVLLHRCQIWTAWSETPVNLVIQNWNVSGGLWLVGVECRSGIQIVLGRL